MTQRRQRTDSAQGQLDMHKDAQAALPNPPRHVRMAKEALPFWVDIVGGRAAGDWTTYQLSLAAQLAQVQYEVQRVTEQTQGADFRYVVPGSGGSVKANPLLTVLDGFNRRQLALVRALNLACSEDPRTQGARDRAFNEARRARQDVLRGLSDRAAGPAMQRDPLGGLIGLDGQLVNGDLLA